jgi:alpha-glucuronidase
VGWVNYLVIVGIVGVQGIYDIPGIIETYGHIQMYQDFTRMAFTDDEKVLGEFNSLVVEGCIAHVYHAATKYTTPSVSHHPESKRSVGECGTGCEFHDAFG